MIPNVVRDGSGRRMYTDRHVMWIELLTRLRATGMSMEEVRTYADLVKQGDATLAERIRFLSAHRVRVKDQILELKSCVGLIDEKLGMYGAWLEAGKSPIEVPAAEKAQAP